MSKKLTRLLVKDLFSVHSIDWALNDDVTVLVGKNGVGKSTLLNLIYCALQPEKLLKKPISFPFSVVGSIELFFDNDSSIKISRQSLNNQDFKELNFIFNNKKNQNDLFESILDSESNKKRKTEIEKIKKELKLFFEYPDLGEKFFHIESKKLSVEFNKLTPNKIEKNYQVEFISTLFMNANSIYEVKRSDGSVANILDLEIREEVLNLLNLKNNKGHISKFLDVMNYFLKDTNKEILRDGDNFKFKSLNQSELLNINQLSSGERQLFYIFIKAINSLSGKDKQVILLMDEPEISLHPAWQDKLLEKLIDINPSAQIILVTHSPAIIMDGWRNKYVDIKNIIS